MRFQIDFDNYDLYDVKQRLGNFQNKSPMAITRAINRTVTTVNSNIKKETRARYHLKASDIQKTLTKSRASRSNLQGSVRSVGSVIPLDKFKVSPKTINPKRKTPVKVAVKRTGSPNPVEGAFMADLNGPKLFMRVGKNRLPIRRLYGPSVPQMLGNEDLQEQIQEIGQETFNKRLDHEINRIIERGK